MGRRSPSLLAGLLTASALAVTSAGDALAQAAPGGALAPGGLPNAGEAARSGAGPRNAPSFGGVITGRMNLIGPAGPDALSPPTLSRPAPPPAPVFSPERIDRLDPAIVDQMRLPNLAPGAASRPTTTTTTSPPTDLGAGAAPLAKQFLTLQGQFDENGSAIPSGVKWRLFTDQADANGEHMLVAESNDARPRFEVDPGAYIVHAVYGLVSAAKFVTVAAGRPTSQTMVLPAGAVRLTAFVGGQQAPEGDVTFTLTRDDGGVARTVAEDVKPGQLLRLPAGSYHVSSVYGDANANVEADLKVAPGKLVEAQVHHKAAHVSLKLVQSPGGPELRDTSWTILTPGGDVIRDSIGALSSVVLAEGDYMAIARRDGRLYQQSFAVRTGVNATVEVAVR
ncbi:hypothetical protein [Chenggangzhangella methanolivorans]|uniref:Carboxypeptidase regulatory-like domain-containing protein n=1 Tax=Chenggangzhangella methanolivorans TaxID=1437009 RepID=A0A9E6RCF1_9HYPH|nr:hypothetical protein [Chenggangzhangella methanolivorans]QZO00744.1 hypothetical protein K6K41_03395 [Chenggangzhangella methanolivorans]